MKLIFVVSLISAYTFVIAVDYCDPKLCSNYNYHIGCNNDGEIYSSCASASEFLDLSIMKENIVDIHNTFRNQIASGKVENFKKAAKMETMQWDDDLAYLAGLNVKTCKFSHDRCRNTEKFKYSGQNICMWMGYPAIDPPEVVESCINDWFKENEHTTMSVIDNYKPSRKRKKQNGHFTVMVVDENNRVGCGLLKTIEGQFTKYVMTCNYARTNMIGEPIYESSDTAGSECPTELNPKYEGLCSPDEE